MLVKNHTICLPLGTAARAPGKMRGYELTLGMIQVCIFIADFVLFYFFKYPAYIVYVVAATGNFVMMVFRLLLVKKMIGFPARKFVVEVLGRILVVTGIAGIVARIVGDLLPDTFVWVVLSILLIVFLTCLAMGILGLNRQERLFVISRIKDRFGR